MKYDMKQIADSIGIRKDIFDKWSGGAIVSKSEDEDGVYNLDGPIVGTDLHAALGYMDGLCSPASLQAFLKANRDQPIQIDINSPGGSVFDANAMYTLLLRHNADITINIIGTCYSAATFFLGLPNAHRVAYDGSDFMVHRAWTYALGNDDDLSKIIDQLQKIDRNIAKRLSKATNYDEKTIYEMMVDETFFGSEDAYSGGFVDELIDGDDDEAEMDEDEDEEMGDDDEKMEFVKPETVNEAEKSVVSLLGLYN